MTPEEMALRRKEMFGGDRFAISASVFYTCTECGSPIPDMAPALNAHFGFHMKIDNISQRSSAHVH